MIGSPALRRAIGRVLVAAALLAAAFAVFRGRQHFIARFFPRGTGNAPPPALIVPPGPHPGLSPARHLRVALLDGVGRAVADRLPTYQALCRRGLSLTVDVGFPSVSLPVQSELWTGLTQEQSGIEFVQGILSPPPAGSLPSREPSSAAVAESHAFIVHSFGFAAALPSLNLESDPVANAAWQGGDFTRVASEQVASDTRLVFVHMLAADTAGHHFGAASPEYAAAARADDDLLAQLLAADAERHGDTSRWLVLADHGHRAGGGHGGAEESIRLVRACLAGAGVPAAPRGASGHLVHMVDLSRAVADSLGLMPLPRSAGRPLGAALAAPAQPGATLPHPRTVRWVVAAVVVALALALSWWAARRAWWLPWWWVIAYLAVVAIEGAPSLSTPMIYPPLGRTMYLAAVPGLVVLAVVAGLAARRLGPARLIATQLLVPAAAALGALVLCWGRPPLMPLWTAHTSLFAVLLFSGLGVVALAVLASLVPFGSDPAPPRGTRDRAP